MDLQAAAILLSERLGSPAVLVLASHFLTNSLTREAVPFMKSIEVANEDRPPWTWIEY